MIEPGGSQNSETFRCPDSWYGDILNEPTLSTCQRIGHTFTKYQDSILICRECGIHFSEKLELAT